MGQALSTADLGRPIRVVFFGGAFLEPEAIDFLDRIDRHPEIALVGGFCESRGFGVGHRVADVVRRRRLLSPFVLGMAMGQAARRVLRRPRQARARRRRTRELLARLAAVPNIHAPDVIASVRALAPDLGVVYGAPLLRPALFDVPAFGTLGIHHGRLPEYRGRKTTFWAMLNGEGTAGVTIQRINAGVDTGEIVAAGEVPIGGRRYGAVHAELQALGVGLYVDAVVAVKRGEARCKAQPAARFPIYRQPRVADILRLWWRQRAPQRQGRSK